MSCGSLPWRLGSILVEKPRSMSLRVKESARVEGDGETFAMEEKSY